LCVTIGAVSRHIGIMEEFVGVKLFARHARGLTLTESGAVYLLSVDQVFDQLVFVILIELVKNPPFLDARPCLSVATACSSRATKVSITDVEPPSAIADAPASRVGAVPSQPNRPAWLTKR